MSTLIETAYGQVPKRPVDLESIHIHDLWHIAQRLPECDRDAVLDVWQLAHDLQEYVLNDKLIVAGPKLLAVCQLIASKMYDAPIGRTAIEDAEVAIAVVTDDA